MQSYLQPERFPLICVSIVLTAEPHRRGCIEKVPEVPAPWHAGRCSAGSVS